MEQFKDIIMIATAVLGGMAVIVPVCIEILKNIIGEEKIVNIFGKMEIFVIIFNAIAGVVGIIAIVLFAPQILAPFNIAQNIFLGLAFILVSIIASSVSYDKVIKWLLSLIKK